MGELNYFIGLNMRNSTHTPLISIYLEKLSKTALKDRQLLIGNLLGLAKDAYDCKSEYFVPICKRIEKECEKRNYKLKNKSGANRK